MKQIFFLFFLFMYFIAPCQTKLSYPVKAKLASMASHAWNASFANHERFSYENWSFDKDSNLVGKSYIYVNKLDRIQIEESFINLNDNKPIMVVCQLQDGKVTSCDTLLAVEMNNKLIRFSNPKDFKMLPDSINCIVLEVEYSFKEKDKYTLERVNIYKDGLWKFIISNKRIN